MASAGEGTQNNDVQGKSDQTRTQRKAETNAAGKNGELPPSGDVGELKQAQAELSAPSTKTRAQRKAEERADAKAGKLTPADEGPTAPTK